LHSILVIPVEKLPLVEALNATVAGRQSELLGVLYLDSCWPFFHLDREALRMLARKVAMVVENAALFAALCEKARLDHEVEITGQIQRQMQPVQFPRVPELEVTGFTVECHAVGGDCLDVVKLSDRCHGLLVGDIAGKGIPASLLASLLQGLFATIGALDLPPEEVVSRVNRYLCERSPEEWYATLFYAILDSSGRLDYVNAGHVPALIRRCSGKVESLESSNFPVGMFSDAQYTRGTTQIEVGNFLLIYTDGIPDTKNRHSEFFGEAGLRRLLQEFPGQTVDDLAEAVRAGVRAFTEGAPQSDDIAVLAVHYRGASSLSTTSLRPARAMRVSKGLGRSAPLVGRIRPTKAELLKGDRPWHL
jgi:sigma-B regulation protein RsbU (phosphoserine phosphatase)